MFKPCAGARTPPLGVGLLEPSRATVTRGEKSVHSLAWSFKGILTGIGFMHWKRVEGSKCEHCLQQWSCVPHFGHGPLNDVPGCSVVEQL